MYVSKPADYPHTPAKLLLFLTGGTGLRSTNNQIQADRYATEGGFLVVMPDLFAGDAAPNSRAPIEEANPSVSASATDNDEASSSFLDTIKLKAVETAKSFLIDMWLARHTEEKVLPRIHAVLDGCREKFPDAIAAGGGIYAVGYCFGGRYVLLLAAKKTAAPAEPASPGVAGWASAVSQTFSSVLSPSSRTDEAAAERGEVKSEGPFIKAGALAHATMVSPDDFVGLVSPVSLVCVEDDPVFPDSVRVAGEEYMEKNGVEHEVHVYPGVPHGMRLSTCFRENLLLGRRDSERSEVGDLKPPSPFRLVKQSNMQHALPLAV